MLVTSLFHITFAVSKKPFQGKSWKFQGSGNSRFGGSGKVRYFIKIPKWQQKLVWNYKRVKLVFYFLKNGAKTCLYGLKISENIEIKHVFQFKAFFHITSSLHTTCFNAFNSSRQVIKNNLKFSPIPQIVQQIPESYCLCIYLLIGQVWWDNELWFKRYIQKCTLYHVPILIMGSQI